MTARVVADCIVAEELTLGDIERTMRDMWALALGGRPGVPVRLVALRVRPDLERADIWHLSLMVEDLLDVAPRGGS